MGKGSVVRPTDKKSFDSNYDKIFGVKDNEHRKTAVHKAKPAKGEK